MDNETIKLEKGELIDITHEKRSEKIPKRAFTKGNFKIHENVYIVESSLIMNKAKKYRPTIDALYFLYDKQHVVIIPSRSYVFFNGKSVEIEKINLLSFIIPSDVELGLRN